MITNLIKTKISQGFLSVFKLNFKQKTSSGKEMDVVREVIFRPKNVVFLILFDPIYGKMLLVKQIRAGVLVEHEHGFCLEPIAGIIEDGQTPEEAAIREAKEEAGIDIKISDLRKIGEGYSSPGISNEYGHVFYSFFDWNSYKEGFYGLEEEHEVIETITLTPDEIEESGLPVSIQALIGIQLVKNYCNLK